MSTIVAQCPNCKARFKVRQAKKMDGAKVVCQRCNAPFRIRIPKSLLRADPSDAEIIEIGDDAILKTDFEIDASVLNLPDEPADAPEFTPGSLMSGRPARRKTGKSKAKSEAAPAKRGQGPSAIAIVLAALATLLMLAGMGAGGYFLFKQAKAKPVFKAPLKFVSFRPNNFPLACEYPDGWKEDHGGGQAGAQAWMRFTDGTIIIEARESISGGAMGQAGIAIADNVTKPGEKPLIAPVESLHLAQKGRFAENYEDYQETPPVKLPKAGYGDNRISDFTAKEGLLKSSVRGCRATLLTTIHQFTVTCKGPPSSFETMKPTYYKVVTSITGGTSP